LGKEEEIKEGIKASRASKTKPGPLLSLDSPLLSTQDPRPKSNPGHIGERQALSPLGQPCSFKMP